MRIDISNRIGTTSNFGGFRGLLDKFSGAAAGYSLRKLSKSATNAVRVRRSSDNTEQNIGFVGTELDTAELLAFVGTGATDDGFVTTWYDQAGSNDATQATAAAQPQIVDGGSLITQNGKVAVQFDGSDDFIETGSVNFGGLVTMFIAAQSSSSAVVYYFDGQSNNNRFALYSDTGNTTYEVFASSNTGVIISFGSTSKAAAGSNNLIYLLKNGSSSEFAENGGSPDTGTLTSDDFIGITIGARFNNILNYADKMREIIIYSSDQSTNRTGIEANINKGFNIYWDGTQKGLLDTYTGAEAAYSLRALNSAYTGAILRVRRASDNAEQDIYAKWDGTLNVEALETFCAATDGYVVTWYDQSGNANNATQATAASQPQIVSSGSIITDSGYQVIQYDGSDDNLGTSFTATGTMLMGGADGGAFYEVAISGAYNLLASASLTDHPLKESIRVVWDRTLSAGEQSAIESRVTYSDWDFSDVTNFLFYWRSRSELTSFPLIDTSNGTNFSFSWRFCNSLTSFPLLDVSSGTNFNYSWFACSSLTSFPLLDVSSGTLFSNTWQNCTSLQDFPANMFDSVTATNFTNAFASTNLTQTSIDNILVSLDTAGQSGGTFNQSAGSAPSATGEAAIDNLRARGWTVTVTGGY